MLFRSRPALGSVARTQGTLCLAVGSGWTGQTAGCSATVVTRGGAASVRESGAPPCGRSARVLASRLGMTQDGGAIGSYGTCLRIEGGDESVSALCFGWIGEGNGG